MGRKKTTSNRKVGKKQAPSVEQAVPIGARLAEATRAYDEEVSDCEDVGDAILASTMATEVNELSTIFVSIEALKEKIRNLEESEEQKRIQHALGQDDVHDDKNKLKALEEHIQELDTTIKSPLTHADYSLDESDSSSGEDLPEDPHWEEDDSPYDHLVDHQGSLEIMGRRVDPSAHAEVAFIKEIMSRLEQKHAALQSLEAKEFTLTQLRDQLQQTSTDLRDRTDGKSSGSDSDGSGDNKSVGSVSSSALRRHLLRLSTELDTSESELKMLNNSLQQQELALSKLLTTKGYKGSTSDATAVKNFIDSAVSDLPSRRPSSVVKNRDTPYNKLATDKKGGTDKGKNGSQAVIIATDSLDTTPTVSEVVNGTSCIARVVFRNDKGVPLAKHPHTETETHYRLRLSRRKSWVMDLASELERSLDSREAGLQKLKLDIVACQTQQESLRKELAVQEKRLMAQDAKEKTGLAEDEATVYSDRNSDIPVWARCAGSNEVDSGDDSKEAVPLGEGALGSPAVKADADPDARSTGALSVISGITAPTVKSTASQASSNGSAKSDAGSASGIDSHGSSDVFQYEEKEDSGVQELAPQPPAGSSGMPLDNRAHVPASSSGTATGEKYQVEPNTTQSDAPPSRGYPRTRYPTHTNTAELRREGDRTPHHYNAAYHQHSPTPPTSLRAQRRIVALERGQDTYVHDGRTYSTLDDVLLSVLGRSHADSPGRGRRSGSIGSGKPFEKGAIPRNLKGAVSSGRPRGSTSAAPASLPDVVARLEELATELEVQKALALSAVITDEAGSGDEKDKTQIQFHGQDTEKLDTSTQHSQEASNDISDMRNILATNGIDLSSLDPDTAAEATVALRIIAELENGNAERDGASTGSHSPAMGMSPLRGKGEEKLRASRGLLSTLKKQQLELEAMRAVIMKGKDYSNFPKLAARGRNLSGQVSAGAASRPFASDSRDPALRQREPAGQSGRVTGRRVARRGARLSTTGDLGVDIDLIRTQAHLDAREQAKMAFQHAAAASSSTIADSSVEMRKQKKGNLESDYASNTSNFSQSGSGTGMITRSRSKGVPAESPDASKSSVSQLTIHSTPSQTNSKNLMPASLRPIQEEHITRREAALWDQWKASGQLRQSSSVKELLAQALSQRDELLKKRGLLSTGTTTADSAVSGDAIKAGTEVLDPVTGFATHPEMHHPMGVLQVTVLSARDLPPRRQSRELNSYVSLDLVLPESAKAQVVQTVVAQKAAAEYFDNSSSSSGSGSMRDATAEGEKQWTRVVAQATAASSAPQVQSARTSAVSGSLYPEWRETFTLHPVTCAWQEVHLRVKDRRAGSLDGDDAILDAVLPLSKLTDQRKKRFRLSLGRPAGALAPAYSTNLSYSSGASAQSGAHLLSKVDPSCSLCLEARLCYTKVGLLDVKIQDIDARIVKLQSLLARLTVESDGSPSQSLRKTHTTRTTTPTSAAGSKLYKSQKRLEMAEQARMKEKERKARERALSLEKKRQRANRASQLSKRGLGIRERSSSATCGGRSPYKGGSFADLPFDQQQRRAQSEEPRGILKKADVGSRLHAASTASSQRKKGRSIGASPLREEILASKHAKINYARQAGFDDNHTLKRGAYDKNASTTTSSGAGTSTSAANTSARALGQPLSTARLNKMKSSRLSSSRKGFGSTTPSGRAPGGMGSQASDKALRSKSVPSTSRRAHGTSSTAAGISAAEELSTPSRGRESYHASFKREMGRKYSSIRVAGSTRTPRGFGSTIATGRSPTGSPARRRSKRGASSPGSSGGGGGGGSGGGIFGSDSVPASPTRTGGGSPLPSPVGKYNTQGTGTTTVEDPTTENDGESGSDTTGQSHVKKLASSLASTDSSKTPFSTAVSRATRNWNSIEGQKSTTPLAPAGVNVGVDYIARGGGYQYNYENETGTGTGVQRTDSMSLYTGTLSRSARQELQSAREAEARSQKLDEYLKSGHMQDMRATDREAHQYAAEQSYRRTFRGAYMKVHQVPRRTQLREERQSRKASASAHFGSVKDRFDSKAGTFK